ncbi:MAG: hypothetical protein L0I76_20115 [Pseudonocardia sp.]|nr:hypothetical protein [Pseudonocardia sp.]
MTDARFPDRWLTDRRVLRLSDHAFRLFVMSLAWSASNRTDGQLDAGDLDLLPGGADEMSCQALVGAQLWAREGNGYVIVDYAATQTTAAQLAASERKRVLDKERQARHRAGQAQSPVTRDVTRDIRATTKDRTGQDRTGQEEGAFGSASTQTDHGRAHFGGDQHLAAVDHAGGVNGQLGDADQLWAAGYDD